MAGTRSYICDYVAAGSLAIQIQAKARLKAICLTISNSVAGGVVELSVSPSSQIGTAQPSSTVIARFRTGAAAATENGAVIYPCDVPLEPFQLVYLHTLGAGIGSVSLCVS